MSTTLEFKQYIEDQIGHINHLAFKKMFGEYGVFIQLKMVAVLCDDQLFVKPTEEGLSVIKDVIYAPPYQGAKPYFLIEDIENKPFLERLLNVTYEALPIPKKKKKKEA